MHKIKSIRWSILLFLLVLNFGIDQISKKIVRVEIGEFEQISIIKDRFTLLKVENTGAFLSLGDEMPYLFRLIILTGLPLAFLAYGTYYLFAKRNLSASFQIALCFLIGGGVGNLYDRILHGSVTDFMHMNFYFFQTGIFNFADISIMIGIGILLVQSLRNKIDSTRSSVEANELG
ncbi:signal peptidase II [Pedobacter sandarakinus]|uniref:signal peptidase II n=1 Tax=Pedobacter sandarakinus TaxID=353156 RepID=UPI0022459483|nr:signal peptidase II [Pedobacter sandarakinus]MCX2576014.1 signal peptidase II [Pedobacter sandarakinus]